MQSSAIGLQTKLTHKPRGFTLIELLVVIVIIGIAVTVASLTVGDAGNRQRVKQTTQRLVNVLAVAQQQAMLQPAVYGLKIQTHGYQFFSFKQDQWTLINQDKILQPVHLSSTITLQLENTDEDGNNPMLLISSSGELTPFVIDVTGKNGKPHYQIIGKHSGSVEWQSLN